LEVATLAKSASKRHGFYRRLLVGGEALRALSAGFAARATRTGSTAGSGRFIGIVVLRVLRRAEVLNMTVGDLSSEDSVVWYRYRGKGNKQGKRELPEPAYVALAAALSAFGRDIAALPPEASLWPSSAGDRGVTSGTFYGNLRRYLKAAGLPLAGVHIFRHSAAKLRRDAGESIENVSRFLDHSSLQVTSIYLRRLEGEADASWGKVAAAIGL
jgi:integrase